MKKYSLIIILIIISASSCKKFLDRTPLDSLTPDQAFSTEQNLQLYVNSFYNQMIPSGNSIYTGDKMSDIQAVRDVPAYLQGVYTSQQATGWTWTPLRNINYFLANYNKAPIAESRKNHYAGIARLFRAWFYFEKVKQFGDVPWYNTTLSPTDEALYTPRDPRTLVMDSVLADINFACSNIDSKKDATASTITRWVALALKSRICLFEGTFRKYHDELSLTGSANLWLQNALEASNEIMASGTSLLNSTNSPDKDYRTLFISESPVSTEVILAVVYNNNLQKWHDANWTYTAASYGGNISFNKRFINTYLNIDGSRFTDLPSYDTVQFQREVKNRDKRLYQTIRTAGYKRSDGTLAPPDFGQAYTGYQEIKFTLDDRSLDGKVDNYNSVPIIRYAEVLLNFAEAKAELGTFTATDWANSVALIRKRAGITNLSMPSTLDAYMKNNFFDDVTSPAIMEIRRERGIELASEGFRYDDLKRWKKGKLLEKEYDGIYVPQKDQLLDLNEDGKPDVAFVDKTPTSPVSGVFYFIIDNTNSKLSSGNSGKLIWRSNITKQFQDYKYFAPIPYNELLLNKNLTQNAGWN